MSAIAGRPAPKTKPMVSSVESVAAYSTKVLGQYTVMIQVKAWAASPAEAADLVQNTMLGETDE